MIRLFPKLNSCYFIDFLSRACSLSLHIVMKEPLIFSTPNGNTRFLCVLCSSTAFYGYFVASPCIPEWCCEFFPQLSITPRKLTMRTIYRDCLWTVSLFLWRLAVLMKHQSQLIAPAVEWSEAHRRKNTETEIPWELSVQQLIQEQLVSTIAACKKCNRSEISSKMTLLCIPYSVYTALTDNSTTT